MICEEELFNCADIGGRIIARYLCNFISRRIFINAGDGRSKRDLGAYTDSSRRSILDGRQPMKRFHALKNKLNSKHYHNLKQISYIYENSHNVVTTLLVSIAMTDAVGITG
jgi:hypothetical protein